MAISTRITIVLGAAFLALAGGGFAFWRGLQPKSDDEKAQMQVHFVSADHPGEENSSDEGRISVTTIHPTVGTVERVVMQPGSVQAYELVQVYAKASGFLKSLNVDIGDRVKKGAVLAIVDIPETEKAVAKARAVVLQAHAKVKQVKSRLESGKAELEAARAMIVQAEANAKSAAAAARFRSKQLERMKDLFSSRSIEEKLVDESIERYEAATESERASVAAIATTKAQATAKAAKIQETEADIEEVVSSVAVSQAELERVLVQQEFATLTAPFDGIITHRSLSPGDYVRAANEGAAQPFLSIQRVDRMRVTVQIPDRDVPFADQGDTAEVQLDAFPGEILRAKISRVSASEDSHTRLMPIEIDLPNADGRIRQGMYGKVRLVLDKVVNQLSVPSACLAGKSQGGKAQVYVVTDAKSELKPIRIGPDDGIRVAVLEGLTAADEVVLRPPSTLQDHSPVVANLQNPKVAAAAR